MFCFLIWQKAKYCNSLILLWKTIWTRKKIEKRFWKFLWFVCHICFWQFWRIKRARQVPIYEFLNQSLLQFWKKELRNLLVWITFYDGTLRKFHFIRTINCTSVSKILLRLKAFWLAPPHWHYLKWHIRGQNESDRLWPWGKKSLFGGFEWADVQLTSLIWHWHFEQKWQEPSILNEEAWAT